MHLAALGSSPEHDEIVLPDQVMDVYPSTQHPNRIVARKLGGCVEDFTCLNSSCADRKGVAVNCTEVPNGEYRATTTDDLHIAAWRSADEDEQIIGYLVTNNDGTSKFVKTLAEAQSYEHRGETARKVLTVAAFILLDAALIAAVVLEDAAVARSE
jgi:hypothetical protein